MIKNLLMIKIVFQESLESCKALIYSKNLYCEGFHDSKHQPDTLNFENLPHVHSLESFEEVNWNTKEAQL